MIDFIKDAGMALVWILLGYFIGESNAAKLSQLQEQDEDSKILEELCSLRSQGSHLFSNLNKCRQSIRALESREKSATWPNFRSSLSLFKSNKRNLFDLCGFKGELQ